MKLHIIYRMCDKVDAVNGLPRPFGMNKKQVIACCFFSLLHSLKFVNDWTIHILADDISDETIQFIKHVTQGNVLFYDQTDAIKEMGKIPPVPTEPQSGAKPPVIRMFNANPPLKSDGALKRAFEIADSITDPDKGTWIYFCEDDYLHDPDAFLPRFLDFIVLAKTRNFALPVFYHPTDYPDQYTRLLSRNYLFQTATGYFREVSSTTMTWMCELKTYRRFSNWLKECIVDDGKFSTIFKKEAMCFSPMPGTATHMHEGVMSQYRDWQAIIANLAQGKA